MRPPYLDTDEEIINEPEKPVLDCVPEKEILQILIWKAASLKNPDDLPLKLDEI